MDRKGQSAMEYLMTYGWAILVIIIVIAVLFYIGVLNPRNITPTSCTFPPGISCGSFKLGTAGGLTMNLGQATGKRIMITGINCTQQQSATAMTYAAPATANLNISNGESGAVCAGACTCTNAAGATLTGNVGDTAKFKIYLQYNETDVSPHIQRTVVGDMAARYE